MDFKPIAGSGNNGTINTNKNNINLNSCNQFNKHDY